MKKLSLTLIFFIIISNSVFAAFGDVAGQYYSTNINTMLNGEEIRSINIGGQTLISAEDMQYYAFSVYWNNEMRELRITSLEHAQSGEPPTVKKSNYPSGMVLGNYYETDIVTYINAEEITSYNIGGETFIHAEELAEHGFLVEWDGKDRNLFVTSPEFAGYKYNFYLTEGKQQTKEGSGGFSLKYTKDGIIGTGDAEYFTSLLYSSGTGYSIQLGFYQNDGLFYSSELLDLLHSLSSGGNAYPIYKPEEKYDLVNENIEVVINGYKAKEIGVASYQGNGHRTFYIEVYDLPKFTEDEIEEIYFSVGKQTETKEFEIAFENTMTTLMLETEKAEKSVLKNPLDWVDNCYTTDEFFALDVMESPSLGVVTCRFYLVNRKTGEVSEDILEQVRQYKGFDKGEISVYAVAVKAVPNNLFFSCMVKGDITKTGDFYVEMDSGTVHFISENIWE